MGCGDEQRKGMTFRLVGDTKIWGVKLWLDTNFCDYDGVFLQKLNLDSISNFGNGCLFIAVDLQSQD